MSGIPPGRWVEGVDVVRLASRFVVIRNECVQFGKGRYVTIVWCGSDVLGCEMCRRLML